MTKSFLTQFSKWRQDDPRINVYLRRHAEPVRRKMVGGMIRFVPHLANLSNRMKGGAALFGNLVSLYQSGVTRWANDWIDEAKNANAEIKRLKHKIALRKAMERQRAASGGSRVGRDILDALAGPAGWIRMGIRRKKEKEIRKLKKEAGELEDYTQ